MISFFVPGNAAPGGSKRVCTRGGRTVILDANPNVRPWKESVREAALVAMRGRPPTREPVALNLTFTRARPKYHFDSKGRVKDRYVGAVPTGRPDALKYARAVEDALSGLIYCDDSQVWRITSEKQYGERPGVSVKASWGE